VDATDGSHGISVSAILFRAEDYASPQRFPDNRQPEILVILFQRHLHDEEASSEASEPQ
jgi:hypothetical protein